MSTLPHDFLRRDLLRTINRNVDALETVQGDLTSLESTVTASGNMRAGTDTVAQSNTTKTVTHNYGSTSYNATVTPTIDPGGRIWVSSKSSNSFVVTLQTAAPVGGISFDWILRGT